MYSHYTVYFRLVVRAMGKRSIVAKIKHKPLIGNPIVNKIMVNIFLDYFPKCTVLVSFQMS